MPQMCREESDLQSSSQSTSQEMKAHSRMTTFSSSMFAFSLRQFFTSVKYADKEKQETKKDSPLFSDTRNKVRPNHMLTINNLIFLLYPLILFTTTQATRFDSIIPGCPDLRSIAEIDSYNGSFCFCDALDENEVSISCLYGSSVQQLQTVINAIEKVNKTLRKITLTRMEFDNATLPASLFHSSLALIQTISVDKCIHIGPLKIHPSAFYGVEQTLEELSITDCKLEEFPREAIHNLTNLKSLSLAHNKLTYLEINDLQSLKKLEALNLEGNFISSLEKGALSTLRNSLHILSYGSHNFVNDSIFEEISQLNELQVLDMNNADGITDIAPGTFLGLSKLEKLLLAGCSLTAIHNETFQGLTKLTELDLRINLLNKIACGSFISTPNLRRLSLAGNYLNESFPCWWNGMKNLKDLDLGWNELAVLENDIFVELGSTLAFLNLRHNKKLVKIADDAFNGLIYVSRLNMSAVSITQLNNTLRHLSSLKELDLSNGQLQNIGDNDFESQVEGLERLLLQGNQLTTLPRRGLEKIKNLKELDLSNNHWLCDDNMEEGKLFVEEIELKYKEAILLDREFNLLHLNQTTCERPYSLKGQIITNIAKGVFKKYNDSEDPVSLSTPTADNGIQLDDINASVITELLSKGGLIGNDNAESEHHLYKSTSFRPLYNVNMETEIVNDSSKSNTTPLIVTIVMLMLISLATTAAVIRHLHLKRRKKDSANKQNNFEMDEQR